jgi:hypothetical protein
MMLVYHTWNRLLHGLYVVFNIIFYFIYKLINNKYQRFGEGFIPFLWIKNKVKTYSIHPDRQSYSIPLDQRLYN